MIPSVVTIQSNALREQVLVKDVDCGCRKVWFIFILLFSFIILPRSDDELKMMSGSFAVQFVFRWE